MPILIAIGGHVGTGKTTLAYGLRTAISSLADAVLVEDDAVRREVRGHDLAYVMQDADYTPEVSENVKDLMRARIEAGLQNKQNVIDASGFFSEERRNHIEAMTRACGADFIGIWLVAPVDVMKRRIQQRANERGNGGPLSIEQGHASDADEAVIDKFGDLGVPASPHWHVVDAGGDKAQTLALCLELISPFFR